MPIVTKRIKLSTRGRDDVVDITGSVSELIGKSKLSEGSITIFVSGSTASVTTIEYEPGLIADVKELGERIAPSNDTYAHNETWGDGNGYSHIRASAIGPSLTVPFENGKMTLGTWQQIVVIDHDTRPRTREIVVQVMGDK